MNIILANVGTVIAFRTGSPIDEQLVLPLFKPFIEEGEIANLPSFNFYARVSAIHSQEPLSGETLLLQDKGSPNTAKEVIRSSRKLYGRKYVEVTTKKAEPVKASTKQVEKNTESNNDQPLDV